MYQLCLQRAFEARHYLIGGDWGAENEVHAHSYRLEWILEGAQLDAHGYLVDLVQVEAHLETVPPHAGVLNETRVLRINLSLEHFCRILAQQLAARLATRPSMHTPSACGRAKPPGLWRRSLMRGWVVDGSLDQLSGGYLFDRIVIDYLRRNGVDLKLFRCDRFVSARWRGLRPALDRRLAGTDLDIVVEDELSHPALIRPNRRLALSGACGVGLVHHLTSSEPRSWLANAAYRASNASTSVLGRVHLQQPDDAETVWRLLVAESTARPPGQRGRGSLRFPAPTVCRRRSTNR
jgi:6-pyruvoyltetrahydropterin/6-carboxytetrahydropterin synthase